MGVWYQEKEKTDFLQGEEMEKQLLINVNYELQVLKFYKNMIIKQVIDFGLQINSLISVLGMKNSGWLLQFTVKLMYTLQNLNKASSLLHAKNFLFCHKIGTLISWEFIEDISKIQQMVKRCVNSHSCFN